MPGSGLRFSRPRTAAQVPGYAAPDQYQQQWNQEATRGRHAAGRQPIVQDGWQWDPVGQQWHPVGSHARAVAGAAGRRSRRPSAAAEERRDEQVAPRPPIGIADAGDGGTQIRPPS